MQLQDGTFPTSRHIEFGPQGDGTQGFLYGSSSEFATGAKEKKCLSNKLIFFASIFDIEQVHLRGIGLQRVNGSPV